MRLPNTWSWNHRRIILFTALEGNKCNVLYCNVRYCNIIWYIATHCIFIWWNVFFTFWSYILILGALLPMELMWGWAAYSFNNTWDGSHNKCARSTYPIPNMLLKKLVTLLLDLLQMFPPEVITVLQLTTWKGNIMYFIAMNVIHSNVWSCKI